jgi:DNA-binding XRE family transcriptional regulator
MEIKLMTFFMVRDEMKTTTTKKPKLPGISLQEHAQILKKKHPDIYAALKHPDPYINLAWNVLDLRHKHGFTQVELAERSGVTDRTIQNIENVNSGYNPTLDVISGLAKTLGAKPEDLIKTIDMTENF